MPYILSLVIQAFRKTDDFLFIAPKFDEFRKAEALRIAYRSMLWTRV